MPDGQEMSGTQSGQGGCPLRLEPREQAKGWSDHLGGWAKKRARTIIEIMITIIEQGDIRYTPLRHKLMLSDMAALQIYS